MKKDIFNTVKRTAYKVGFKLKKHSPEILIVGGVIGTVASAVMACKATLKVNDILTDTKEQLDKIHECAEDADLKEYTESDSKKDIAIVYAQTGVKLAKLYGPAVALGALSIGGMVASNNILRKRNVAMAAAYATIDKSFKEYRGRVVERFGEEVDHQLKYNIKAVQVSENTTDEKGKEKAVSKNVEVADPNLTSDYARYFDEASSYWQKNPEYNLMFLRAQQAHANDLLKSRGYLFLNEVYRMLDIPETKAGQIVGWVYDAKNPVGDNYVDFGIYELSNQRNRDFVNGYERVILLDFNVDGNILDLM